MAEPVASFSTLNCILHFNCYNKSLTAFYCIKKSIFSNYKKMLSIDLITKYMMGVSDWFLKVSSWLILTVCSHKTLMKANLGRKGFI